MKKLTTEQKNFTNELTKIVKEFNVEYLRKYSESRKYGMYVKFYFCDSNVTNQELKNRIEEMSGVSEVKIETNRKFPGVYDTSLKIKVNVF
jgi:hypothetical protein